MSVLDRLRHLETDKVLSSAEVFDAIYDAGSILSESDREANLALEISIRLLEAKRVGLIPPGCEEVVEFLAEECGLYPYINAERFAHMTQAVIEAHAVQLSDRLYLHSKQMQMLLWMLNGDNLILSAPTSFGKSLLVDAFIAHKKPQTVVMILPTIALIDEARRRLLRNFSDDYDLITTSSETYQANQRTIFVLTQERFLQRKDEIDIDLLFIDEFYKLDPARHDDRYETLNLALYRALPRAKQCFMAGPHIRNIELGVRWRGSFRFVQTDYRTVTVNVVDRSAHGERLETFLDDLRRIGSESALVFTASPATAHQLMGNIIAAEIVHPTELGQALGAWIAENYHREWAITDGAAQGVTVHHGRLPRSLGQLFVRLFDEGVIRVLICTSTLIEGVNTSAANVFIFDKKINRTDFDFFSFANIRGRVGRMMRHFVGNAFLYHEAPAEIETRVEVPVLANPGGSTDFIVMNVRRDELSAEGQERQDRLPEATGLDQQILREHGAIGVDTLVELARRVDEGLASNPHSLVWNGFPDQTQRIALAELALMVAHGRNVAIGIHTARQVAWSWEQLRKCRTLPKFLRWFASTFFTQDISTGIDAAFQFLQACEYTFPRTISAVEAIVRFKRADDGVGYASYAVMLEQWFRPAWIKQVDEAGIPVPLAERLQKYVGQPESRAVAIRTIRALDLEHIPELDAIDRFILRKALEV